MKTLNLVNPGKSDIKYKPSNFPDGQQNIVILGIENGKGELLVPYNTPELYKKCPIQIKSRLNNWLDLELITCTVASLRELGVEEIHLYTPYFLGSRSDRQFEEGSNNYLKDVICPIINSLEFESVTVLDPHSDVLEACLNNFKKESNKKLVWFAMEEIYGIGKVGPFTEPNFVLVSPDAGASKKIYKLAEQIGYKGDIITCSKDRDENGKLTKTVVPYQVTHSNANKDIIIIDDICDGGATFINISKELKGKTLGKIYLVVTHGIFSKGFAELSQYFDGIYTTNSYGQLLTDVYTGHGNFDQWLGSTEEQYYPEIKQGFIKQLNVY